MTPLPVTLPCVPLEGLYASAGCNFPETFRVLRGFNKREVVALRIRLDLRMGTFLRQLGKYQEKAGVLLGDANRLTGEG